MLRFIDPHSDPWRPAGGEDGPQPHPPVRPHSLLSLEQWHAVRDHWPTDTPVGVGVPNTVDIETLAADLPRLALVVLQFPKWTDGRAYSQARLLRARHRFASDVRAQGDVVADMAPLLLRTGFSSAQLRHDQKRDIAERLLGGFAGHYQGDVHEPRPAFARDWQRELERAREQVLLSAGEGI